jgi:crotonobetainyl-CoA:carnitine CoA-transferase CaiB-like acyl-CoA transferase
MTTDPPARHGPLTDIVVFDLTWVLAGPYAAMILTDMGADVIKVERPPFGDVGRTTAPYIGDESVYFFSVNRGKQSICLDLKSDAGRELFLRLVEKADVVMENFTPGTMDRLGLGYETLRARNPRLIYSATSGFGQTGPDRERPALDIIVQGMGGIMSITGEPGGPPVRPGVSQGDITAGLFTAVGILSALHERERSGEGQMLDVSMLDSQIALMENPIARYFATGEIPQKLGTRHPSTTPFQAFPTADGYVVVALYWGVENQWELFCVTVGVPHPQPRRAGAATQRRSCPENDRRVARRVRRHRHALRPLERRSERRHPPASSRPRDDPRGRAPLRLLAESHRHAAQAQPHARRRPGPAPGDRRGHGRGTGEAPRVIHTRAGGAPRTEGDFRPDAKPRPPHTHTRKGRSVENVCAFVRPHG